MFYIQQDEKIVLFDEDKQKLQDTIAFMPQYEGLEIKEVEEGYVIYDFELMTVEEKKEKEAKKERERLDKLSMTRGDVFEASHLTRLDYRILLSHNMLNYYINGNSKKLHSYCILRL